MLMNVNEFLLGVSGVAATLIGTFIVGVFFYIDTDLHRMLMSSDAADRYLRSGVRWVLVVYSLPLFVPLTLAAFEPIWGTVVFIALSAMLLLSTLGVIVFMGFGFVVSGIAKNESSVPPIANIITLPQFLLSGTFFSINVFPSWLQPISRALPLTYLNDALRKVAFEGAGLFDVTHQIFIMLIWGVVIYAVAVKLFKWE